MKKKFVTTTLTAVFTAICFFSFSGFTECGKTNETPNDNPDDTAIVGVEVTKDTWEKAFDTLEAIDNVTSCYRQEINMDIAQSSMSETAYINSNSIYGIYEQRRGTLSNTVYGLIKFDIDNAKILYATKENSNNVETHSQAYESNDTVKQYYKEQTWHMSGLCLYPYYMTEEQFNNSHSHTDAELLKNLYSEFTFADGKYTANIWVCFYNLNFGPFDALADIELTFDNNGNLANWSLSCTPNYSGCNDIRMNVKLYDYGTTTISAPKELTDALENL